MDFEAELQSHNEPLFEACAIRSHEHVLDIGCGTGQTTREAARRASAGGAVGIDITETMIATARARAAAEHLHNVRFEHADAQTRGFQQRSFDLAISRYGTMFFADPIAAFRNIGSALRTDGRLVMMVWQAHELNEWSVAIQRALTPFDSSNPDRHAHFSFASPSMVEDTLSSAGFSKARLIDVREPVYYGADLDTAVEWVKGFRYVRSILQRLDVAAGTHLLELLRENLAGYVTDEGVWIAAREWIAIFDRC